MEDLEPSGAKTEDKDEKMELRFACEGGAAKGPKAGEPDGVHTGVTTDEDWVADGAD